MPARFSSSVFVVARVLSCTSGRAVAYFHIPTRLCCYTFTTQVRLSEEHAKVDVDVGPDADTWEVVEIEIQEEAEAEAEAEAEGGRPGGSSRYRC